MKIIERTFDAQTGETVDIERDETAAEKKHREAKAKEVAAELAEAKAKETAKAAILDRLGLTADEAQLLLG
jgi:predicted house-cleaning NTP pyrophosphatase (Maf/HAM1 superfamily)